MVISTVNQVIYNGDGITTAWPYTFRIIDATDIKLTIIDADGTETDVSADYFVDTVNNTVYYPGYAPGAEPPEEEQTPVLPSGKKLLIYRQLPVTQEKDLGEKWPFEVIELGLDKLTMILQQVYGWWGRCLKISPVAQAEHPDFDMTFPIEAGKSFRVNAEGTGFEASDDPGIAAEEAYEALAEAENAKDAALSAQAAAEAAAAVTDLQALWFDDVAGLVDADIPVGVTAGIKGSYEINDGGNATYNIRAKTDSDVNDGVNIIFLDNGNVAERLVSKNEILAKMVDNIDLRRSPFIVFEEDDFGRGTQGMCVAKDFIVTTFQGASDADPTRVYVVKISDKTIVGHIDYSLGHANSLCYDKDNDLVCVANATTVHRFAISDEGVLSHYDDVAFSYGVTGIGWNNGEFYCRNGNTIRVTKNFSTIDRTFDVKPEYLTLDIDMINQGMAVDDHFIYMPYTGIADIERLFIYDKHDGTLLKQMDYPFRTFGEFEELDFYNGYMFINVYRTATYSNAIFQVPLYKKVPNLPDKLRSNLDSNGMLALQANHYGKDLNDYVDVGLYEVELASSAECAANHFPNDTVRAFVEVRRSSTSPQLVHQTLYRLSTTNAHEVYTRIYTLGIGAWTDWSLIYGNETNGTISLSSGSFDEDSVCIREGRVCEVYISVSGLSLTLNTWTDIATINGNMFAPIKEIDFAGIDNTNGTALQCKLTTGRKIRVYPVQALTKARIHVTYISRYY